MSVAVLGSVSKLVTKLPLPLSLAIKSLQHHRIVALVTVIGIALGVAVVGGILIVDANTRHDLPRPAVAGSPAGTALDDGQPRFQVFFERAADAERRTALVPTQRDQAQPSTEAEAPRRGEADYQAMRLAVRLASLLALFVGTVVVFYTMRYSVAARAKEFSLLLCLGEHRAKVGLSVVLEALLLGAAGAALGLALSFAIALLLLRMGISTNGRMPMAGFAVPWFELLAMAAISLLIALAGVISPIRGVYRLGIAEVLQPRFLSRDFGARALNTPALTWLIPPFLAATYIGLRPFLESWLSVVYFFLFEAAFVALIAVATLWWIEPLLRGLLRLFEGLLQPLLPLEVFLTGRRLRLTGRSIRFSVIGVTLVFSLLTGLHDITRALKDEIRRWSAEAVAPYSYFTRGFVTEANEPALQEVLQREGIRLFRLSDKLPGDFPIRLIRAADINPYRAERGQEPLRPGRVILSRTLASRFGLSPGDSVVIRTAEAKHRFAVIEVSDAVGYVAASGQYVDLKSFALMSEGNPLFADNLERSLGRYTKARSAEPEGGALDRAQIGALSPFYYFLKQGRGQGLWQVREIDRDFLIFDFILLMTITLAGIGVANTMLIQVHAREREFSLLRSVGIDRWQVTKLLLLEGTLIGLVGGAIAIVLGNALGAISVSFLDHFTLFDYRFRFSPQVSLYVCALAVVTCQVSALYPALVARRTSSAEALHYE